MMEVVDVAGYWVVCMLGVEVAALHGPAACQLEETHDGDCDFCRLNQLRVCVCVLVCAGAGVGAAAVHGPCGLPIMLLFAAVGLCSPSVVCFHTHVGSCMRCSLNTENGWTSSGLAGVVQTQHYHRKLGVFPAAKSTM
jgi:hypothetical protein